MEGTRVPEEKKKTTDLPNVTDGTTHLLGLYYLKFNKFSTIETT
jgi:hypothetical protein